MFSYPTYNQADNLTKDKELSMGLLWEYLIT